MTNSKKTIWISAANVFACFSVIVLHCNGVFWSFPKGRAWYTSNFLETFFYWAVPVFFMNAGATSINYRVRYSTEEFLKRRFGRTLIPFLFWSLAALVFQRYFGGIEVHSVRDIISGIINTQFFSIYWFFIPLFTVYLSVPLLSAVREELRNSVFKYTVFVTFLLTSVLPTLFSLLHINYNTDLQMPVSGGYILYVLVGYLIATTDVKKKQRIIVYLLAFLGWFIHFQGTTILSFRTGEIAGTFKGYINFPTVVHSTGVYVFFKYFPWERVFGKKGISIIESLSKYTFGIYLMHFYFVLAIPSILGFNVGSIYWRTLGAVGIFAICALLSKFFSRVPILRRVIGL